MRAGLPSFIAAWLIALAACPPCSRAERFESAEEAARLAFPAANRFEPRELALSKAQADRIKELCKEKVRQDRVRFLAAWKDKEFLGVMILDQVFGKHEIIDYTVAVSPDGAVKQVEILEYRERYGGQVRSAEWRAQFTGKTIKAPLKLNDDISNISGATISCRNVTDGVRRVLATYAVVVAPGPGLDRLPNSQPAKAKP